MARKLAIAAEVFGGLGLILGFLTRIAAFSIDRAIATASPTSQPGMARS